MLKQSQKKVASAKEFTNRLTFLSNAMEVCARAYESTDAFGKPRKSEIGEGSGMLLFIPPKPSEANLRLYDNIACHRHYRNALAQAQAEEKAARTRLIAAERDVESKGNAAKQAADALSKAKQALGSGRISQSQLNEAQRTCDIMQQKLKSVREEHKRLKELRSQAEKRASACQKELAKLQEARMNSPKGRQPAQSYEEFANSVRAFNGKPPALEHDLSDPSCFDDIIGLSLPPKETTPSDLSRLRTDSSNADILSKFIAANNVMSPAYEQAGFPPCKTSLLRDADPALCEAIIHAARKRVMALIAVPELGIGAYETPDEQAKLLEALGFAQQDEAVLGGPAACIPTSDGPAPRTAAPNAPSSAASSHAALSLVEHGRDAEENILYNLVTSDAFPVMAEDMLKPAVLESLARFGDTPAQDAFVQKCSVLAYNEQRARESYAESLGGSRASISRHYATQLRERGEMLSLMLSTALLGAPAVEAYPVDLENMKRILTKEPGLGAYGKAGRMGQRRAKAVLVEQIPNSDGSFSFGRHFELSEGTRTTIGRAPYDDAADRIIVPAGHSPYPGLLDFACRVSRAHALLEHTQQGWQLSDAGSSYGTAVGRFAQANGSMEVKPLEEDASMTLLNGDVVILAPLANANGWHLDAEHGFSYRFEIIS